MKTYRFDVIIIGGGPAGITAAGSLAGTGISVAVIESGAYAGAENWSGCVYFAESLAAQDCFGPAAVEAAPYERQVTRRGTLVHNGLDVLGAALTDPGVFVNSYTVLRPVYDPYFAALARSRGAVLLTGTTVTSLIRKAGRVAGVQTTRGPLFAGVVFIAEGDASHLVRSEGLERVRSPHYLQGVKAVLSMPAPEIERRFGLSRGEGAAFEILIRNGAIAGRTAHLNMGGFLYTNRNSLSLGFVVPLDNLRKNFRGDHSRLLEWMRSLPELNALTDGALLSSYGTKIIRSGGWRERPVLVEDGLVVGGASAGLGIDLPFPNFTGPASATGLFFGRAVRSLLRDGRTLDRRNLASAYLDPLMQSVYGKNARYLSRWPDYFSRSRVLFGRTADLACGMSRFLTTGGIMDAARFLRSHALSFRALREFAADAVAAFRSLRLGKPLAKALFDPRTVVSWIANMVLRAPAPDRRFTFILTINGRKIDPASLRPPLAGLLRRMQPALARAAALVYANDRVPFREKLSDAVRVLSQSIALADLIVLPLFLLTLAVLSLAAALYDAFRYYVLKTPAERMLAEPVMAYTEAQRKARDMDGVKLTMSLEAKLATNTSLVGSEPHIRTLWPAAIAKQQEISQAGLWWICPARVYRYEAPLMGRGAVTVNWENCIKCETCWRAEPSVALWGRFTDHRLIYRPESAAIPDLLAALKQHASRGAPAAPGMIDRALWYARPAAVGALRSALNALSSYHEAVRGLPASADASRLAWTASIGLRLTAKMKKLEAALEVEVRPDVLQEMKAARTGIEQRLREGRIFHALYAVQQLRQQLSSWLQENDRSGAAAQAASPGASFEEASRLFPDRVVKQWEELPLPGEWADRLREFLLAHLHPSRPAIREISAVSPALGLIAACQSRAARILLGAGKDAEAGICAADGSALEITTEGAAIRISGTLRLVPLAASSALMIISPGRAYIVPLASAGVTVTAIPAIGFRAAGLADVAFDRTLDVRDALIVDAAGPDHGSFLAIALGAATYLSRRAQEYAADRVQFPGQMLDTEGRDGIAKLGAVKALVARIEAWRLLLKTLDRAFPHPSHPPRGSADEFGLLCSTIAGIAFGPENGCMAYDAGQVFGGFAFSEDDLLSRFYRDSSLFRFLGPVHHAAAQFSSAVAGRPLADLCVPELGSLDRIAEEPLAPLAALWRESARGFASLPGNADAGLRGEAAAILVATRGLLASIEQDLASGGSPESGAAAAEVLLGAAQDALMRARLSAGQGQVEPDDVFPLSPEGPAVALASDYESFCTAPGRPHRSGMFLVSVFDRSPRYVPEMQLHDPKLRARWAELAGWFRTNCSERTFNGLSFERRVEQLHHLPDEVVDAVKQHRWLATTVPAAEDGLAWRKAEYYILNSAAGSFGDAGVCLLIMASTSIGTTPILLGIEDELPRVREELEPLTRDAKRLGEIGIRIRRMIATFRNPNPAWIRREFEGVMRLVEARIRRTRVVKYLAANFLRAFYGAGIAGRRGDFGGFTSGLQQAAELFDRLMPDVRAALEELPRRDRCHRLHLRTLGHGGVSAFALTEPSAGSDSGGVKTTAALRTAMLTPLPDGRYAFAPAGDLDKGKRYLVDADRIVFSGAGMAYRTPDNAEAPVLFDRYDYSTDEGARAYVYQGTRCEFHDIGQVRATAAGQAYEYYSLTGAKMWITNGSLATQFCLYAQTPEGVTGFIVDRHAEGLKVGADEHKTGQRGSPTNEISLDSVRVAREAVIGYEGHGQVNALETLNVGRCGLAVVAGAIARKVHAEALAALPASAERDRLLGEAASIIFGSESLAYYLVGLFDRPHESVRMESAIAKFVCSEDLHEVLSLIERAYGPAGQTERYLLEKARRDARILNIYEGTNEVQRFLVLKDLIGQAADWPELPERLPEQPGDAPAMLLARWKNRLGGRVRAAASQFGDTAWMDAMLQPGLFLLSEMAGEVLRLECVQYRLEWLAQQRDALGGKYTDGLTAAGGRAKERCLARLSHLDGRFAAAWARLSRNLSVAEVRAADAAMDMAGRAAGAARHLPASVTGPLRILSLVRPVAELSPAPRLVRGAIEELVWKADPLDHAALDQALVLKQSAAAPVTVDVLLPGGIEHQDLLRGLAPSADRLIRLDTASGRGQDLAAAIRVLERSSRYDIIVLGSLALDGDQVLASVLAGSLDRPHAPLQRLAQALDGSPGNRAPLPAVVSISGRTAPRETDVAGMVASLFREVEVLPQPAAVQARPPLFIRPGGKTEAFSTVATVSGAADMIRKFAEAASAAKAEPFGGYLRKGSIAQEAATWAILDPSSPRAGLAALRGCKLAADLFGRRACCLVAAPQEQWPDLLGLARLNGCDQAFCLDTGNGSLSGPGRLTALSLLTDASGPSLVLAGPGWGDAFGISAGRSTGPRPVPLASGVTDLRPQPDGTLTVSSPAYDGMLVRQESFGDGTAFLTMSDSAELPQPSTAAGFSAAALELEMRPEWTVPLPPAAAPTLAEAEVIIDIGYGVKDRTGMDLAMELKRRLESLGLSPLFGATRKVTQDLKLLPLEAQIGQTGVRVNPKLVICLGISGAPQHIDWIGTRAEVLCFNKDPDAPLMKLNQTRPAPRVHPVLGDLFLTVRELMEKLG